MFGMKEDKYGKVDSLIGSEAEVKGDIVTKATIRVDGRVEGDIHGEGDVVVGKDGNIKGDIKAKVIILGGKIIGNIFAEERVEVIDGGQVMGDIKSPAVVIAEGGIFEGHCEMMSSAKGKILEIPEKRSKGSQG